MNTNVIKTNINVNGNNIGVMRVNNVDYISLTDLARYADDEEPRLPIQNWMRTKDIISYLGLWEIINNKNFKRVEFDTFENQAGSNKFKMSPQKWIKATDAIKNMVPSLTEKQIRKVYAKEVDVLNINQSKRLIKLNKTAKRQIELFKNNNSIKKIE